MNAQETRKLKKLLTEKRNNIFIVSHRNPDGDAIGSMLGLNHILKKLGNDVRMAVPNEFPNYLKWLPGSSHILRMEWSPEKASTLIAGADIIFAVDFNDLKRIDLLGEQVAKSSALKVLIDHHQNPSDFAEIIYSDESFPATSEMIYNFAFRIGAEKYINTKVANCLLAGIMTDSGNFTFPKTTAQTHRVAADLIDRGADSFAIHEKTSMKFAPSRLKLLGQALSNMQIIKDCGSVFMTLSQEELDALEFKKGDTEGFVNYPLTLEGINFSALFIENRRDEIIKVSLRSRGQFSVHKLGREYFNGGGHLNAAGGTLKTTDLKKAADVFTEAVNKYKDEIVASYNSSLDE